MFKVNMNMYVWDGAGLELSKTYSVIYKNGVELPFPPYAGLGIRFSLEREWRIKSVTWEVEEQFFVCQLEDQFTNYLGVDDPTFEEFMEELEENGWSSIGVYSKDS